MSDDPLLIDAHAHLETVESIDEAVRKAAAAGVGRIVAVGMDLDSNARTLEIAARFPETVLPAVGYHPWRIRAEDVEACLKFVEDHLDRCVALGEVGLDYKVKVKKPLQWEVFARLLTLARDRNKPVIVHSRFSYERTFEMVSSAGIEKAVFHWYSGPVEILERILEQGYYISATPALAYSRFHQAAVRKAPLERILIETDSPVEYQGKKATPANVVDTLKSLSRLKNMATEEIAAATTHNAKQFFGL